MMVSYLVKLTNGNQKQITADEISFKNGYLCSKINGKWLNVEPVGRLMGPPKQLRTTKRR